MIIKIQTKDHYHEENILIENEIAFARWADTVNSFGKLYL